MREPAGRGFKEPGNLKKKKRIVGKIVSFSLNLVIFGSPRHPRATLSAVTRETHHEDLAKVQNSIPLPCNREIGAHAEVV